MRVFITDPAVNDLIEIEIYISQDNIDAAGRLIQTLENRCLSLGDSPNIGRKRDYIRRGLRTIAEGNYLICYRIAGQQIEILRVLHGARNIEAILANRD